MARRNRPQRDPARPLSSGSVRRVDVQADGEWIVSTWSSRPDAHTYVCPVCGGRLAATTSHLVVWPREAGAADRRHVHSACWRRRAAQRDPVRW